MFAAGIFVVPRQRRRSTLQQGHNTRVLHFLLTTILLPGMFYISTHSLLLQQHSILHSQRQYQRRRRPLLLRQRLREKSLKTDSVANRQWSILERPSFRRVQYTMHSISAPISSSVLDFVLSSNETSDTYDNFYNTNRNNYENSTMPKMIQNDDIWNSYSEMMEEIIIREFKYRNRGALQSHELAIVKEYLLKNTFVVSQKIPGTAIDVQSESRLSIRDTLHERKELFSQHTKFTNPMYELYCRCLIYMNDMSARKQIRSPVLPTWYKVLECGLCPRENAISTCLYVMSIQPPQVTKNNYVDNDDELFKNACLQIATFHDLLYSPNEKTILVRIKAYIADHNAHAAEQVLATLQIKSGNDSNTSTNYEDSMSCKRLRTYQPIYQYYCDTGNIMDALRIYRDMQHTAGVYLIAETYAMLISAAAKNGWFRSDYESSNEDNSLRSAAMKHLKFRNYCGPDLLNELCTDMSRDILELDESCAAMIIDGFNVGFNFTQSSQPAIRSLGWISDISQWLQQVLHSPTHASATNTGVNHRRLLMERVSIDNTTAICPSSGAKLRLLTLSKHQIRNVHDSLLQMATLEQDKFSEKANAKNGSKRNKAAKGPTNSSAPMIVSRNSTSSNAKNTTAAVKELALFSDWLKYRTGDAFTAIIDGPNVAYYGHGDVRWCQVEQVLNKLEAMGENPLVIMPQKYLSPKFYIASLGRTQELSSSDLSFIKKLVEMKKMYVVPSNCLDDYYWMLSSVAEQKAQPKNSRQYVPTDDSMGRFPGLRPLLVTNDQMRDHRLALLEPRLFRRWTSCHIVKYHIEPTDREIMVDDTVTLFPADFFSREIQCNKATRYGDSTAWHFPIAEWPEPDRLCLSVLL